MTQSPKRIPKRILVIASRFPLASETFVRTKCAALVALGHDVEILSLSAGDDAEEDFDRAAQLRARTRVAGIHTPLLQRLVRLPPRVLRLAQTSPRAALGVLSLRGGWRAYSGQLAAIGAVLGAPRAFDLVCAEFGPAGAIACDMRRAGLFDAPIVTAFYGYDVTRALRTQPHIYDTLFREGELFLPNSQHLARLLIEHGAPSARVVVHRLGIDLARFPEVTTTRPLGPTRALAVGRFVEKKGFGNLLLALAAARSRTDCVLRLVGDGPLAPELRSAVRTLKLENRVEFAGWRTHSEVAHDMAHADFVAVPSVVARDGDVEGVPLVAIEAMATGLPVLASRHGGLPELIEDGTHGVLCDEGDVPALAEGLVALSDPTRRELFRRHSRARIVADYDANALAHRLVELGCGVA
ncbi:MAG: glycosyltransferase [Limnohabitans sp.]|jgi:colanic acid/amylovoran biosynthesis glycosyltransferase|nr:glycosyltransferase [Limnohabitans sp.]